jgi:valyl-tRNA synthetase
MSNAGSRLKHELKEAIPPFLYFLVAFHLVAVVRALMQQEYGIQPGASVRLRLERRLPAVTSEVGTVKRLARVAELSFGPPPSEPGGHAVLSDGTGLFVPLGDAIDIRRECTRIGGEVSRLRQLIDAQRRKLGNEQFVARAPAAVVDAERTKLASWQEQANALAAKMELLGCGDGSRDVGGPDRE